MQPAKYWEQRGGRVVCRLCPHHCSLKPEQLGRCGVRRHHEGGLVTETYGLVSSLAMDPIEKKPLYHLRPGSSVLSLGSAGCNFRCSFCQNWSISQRKPPLSPLTPEDVAAEAAAQGAVGVAYTYNEPLMNYEYVLDCARAVRERGLLNVLVTNGYLDPEPRRELLPWIDALNIDLKAATSGFYRRFCGARVEPVQDLIRAAAAVCHVELTNLLVTGGNDSPEDIRALVDWVADLSPEIPLHFSRYFPQYQWDEPPTDSAVMAMAREYGRTRLKWVYTGNWAGQDDSTRCPDCGDLLIARRGYEVTQVRVAEGLCPKCRRKVPGLF